MPVTAADRRFMRRALALAERGWGRVHPNPLVGAVLVRDGLVVGSGYHAAYGSDHAEVAALRDAGPRARGATLYCTLEPCVHHGKTPPCTDAILAAGVARVVYAASDPNRLARGGGGRLQDAGLEVLGGVEEASARRQNAAYFHAVEREAVYVALKYALTLDARLAASPRERSAITGAAALAEVQRIRAGFDAILVGSTTARTDDPLLTVRGRIRPRIPPIRMVLDSDALLSPGSKLVRGVADAPLWVFCAEDAARPRRDALSAAGVRVIPVPRGASGLDMGAVLDTTWQEGLRSILCEGGGRLGSTLVAGGFVQRLYLFYAPILFGETGVPAFPGAPVASPGRTPGWAITKVRRVGGDSLLVLDREG